MNTPRNGYTRGQSPKRPGDLTGRILVANQTQSDMSKPSVDADAIRASAYQAGYDTGFSDGIRWIQENYDVYELEDAEPGTNEMERS